MSLWGQSRVDVRSWREVLAQVPRAVSRMLQVRGEGLPVKGGCPWASGGVGVQDGVVVLVDPGAEEAPPQAALRLWLEGDHLAWEELVQVFVGVRVPAA